MSSVEGHAQIGYASNTKKRYGPNGFVKNQNTVVEEETPLKTNVEE